MDVTDFGRLVEDLRNQGDWSTRETAATTIADADASALDTSVVQTLLAALRETFARDWDWDTKNACLDAIVNLETDPVQLSKDLAVAISDGHPDVRRKAVSLAQDLDEPYGDLRGSAIKQIAEELEHDIVYGLTKIIVSTDESPEVAATVNNLLKSEDTSNVLAGMAMATLTTVPEVERERARQRGWQELSTIENRDRADLIYGRLTRLVPDPDELISEFLAANSINNALQSRYVFATLHQATGALARWSADRASLIPHIVRVLKSEDRDARAEATAFLHEHLGELTSDESSAMVSALVESVRTFGDATQILAIYDLNRRDIIESEIERSPELTSSVARALISRPEAFDAVFASPERASRMALELLEPGEVELTENILEWARDRVHGFSPAMCAEWESRISALAPYLSSSPAVEALRIRLNERIQAKDAAPLISLLRTGDDGSKREAVAKLVELNTSDAIRQLVQEWGHWILSQQNRGLVDLAAIRFRRCSYAVLPLLDLLQVDVEIDSATVDSISDSAVPSDCKEAVEAILDQSAVRQHHIEALGEWLERLSNEGEGDDDLATKISAIELRQSMPRGAWRDLIGLLANRETARRRNQLHFRVARQLAEMSDSRFFTEHMDDYSAVRQELLMHAVSRLGQRLIDDDPTTDTLEWLARTLANLSGPDSPEAIEALTRAVLGEERTRASRRDLLSRYYLEPSKERSDQAAKLLADAVKEAKNTLRLLQVLNVVFFIIAIISFGVGVYLIVDGNSASVQLAGVAVSGGSVLGFLVQMMREPLGQIQNAMSRLVQIETAFASFVWELNLNGTYIQSKYVAEGQLTNSSVAATVARIEDAMVLAMDLVSTYAHGESNVNNNRSPLLTRAVPMSGSGGTAISLYGGNLGPRSSRRSNDDRHVLIDHRIVKTDTVRWQDDRVTLTLPEEVLSLSVAGGGGSPHTHRVTWISVVVNGNESNTVPLIFHDGENELPPEEHRQ